MCTALKEVSKPVEVEAVVEAKMEDAVPAPIAPVVVEPLNNMNWDLDALLTSTPAYYANEPVPAYVLATTTTIAQGQGRKVKMIYDENDQFVGFADCYGKNNEKTNK